MRIFRKLTVVLLALSFLIPAHATDGYFALGYGSRHKGLAGAGLSLIDLSIIAGNPAGNAFLDNGYMISIGLFSPDRYYRVIGNPSMQPNTFGLQPADVQSDNRFFPIPALGANWKLGESSAIGAAIYGNGGMNTEYPAAVFFDQSSETTGVNLSQLFGEVTFSQQINEKHSIGVSAILAYQMFEAYGLAAFGQFGLSSDPSKLSGNGTDNSTGFGFKIGYQGELVPNLRLGLMYQSKMYMSEFEEYAGLFAEEGGFDIPASWGAGLSYSFDGGLTVAADVRQILYSDVRSIGNPMNPANLFPAFLNEGGDPNNPMDYTPNPNYVPLGAEEGAGFGWQDMTVFKLGLEYAGVEDWIFRGGFSYGQQPIPEEEVLFNILAPGVIENHLALGFSRRVGQGNSMIHFAFNYALTKTVMGVNPLDPVQRIELEMSQFDIDLGFSF